MGKPLDSRMVEYAYKINETRSFNVIETIGDTNFYYHSVTITYQLKDVNHEFLGNMDIPHRTDNYADMETVAQSDARLNPLIDGWVASDKLALSGYSS